MSMGTLSFFDWLSGDRLVDAFTLGVYIVEFRLLFPELPRAYIFKSLLSLISLASDFCILLSALMLKFCLFPNEPLLFEEETCSNFAVWAKLWVDYRILEGRFGFCQDGMSLRLGFIICRDGSGTLPGLIWFRVF